MAGQLLHFSLFFLFQIAANLLFKYGSGAPERWWWGFLGGNAFGVSGIVFFMAIYKRLPANGAAMYVAGGTFLSVQLALWLCYRGTLTLGQWLAIVLIAGGMGLFGWTAVPVPAAGAP